MLAHPVIESPKPYHENGKGKLFFFCVFSGIKSSNFSATSVPTLAILYKISLLCCSETQILFQIKEVLNSGYCAITSKYCTKKSP